MLPLANEQVMTAERRALWSISSQTFSKPQARQNRSARASSTRTYRKSWWNRSWTPFVRLA